MRMSGSLVKQDYPVVEASILESLIEIDATFVDANITIVSTEEEIDVETR